MPSMLTLSRIASAFLALAVVAAPENSARRARVQYQPADPFFDPRSWRPVVFSEGWRVMQVSVNDRGTVLFAGGAGLYFADGLVLCSGGLCDKFAASGDPAPGIPGRHLDSFPVQAYRGGIGLNDTDEVVFGATLRSTGSADEPSSALFIRSGGSIRKIVAPGDFLPGDPGWRFGSFSNVQIGGVGTVVFTAQVDGSLLERSGWTGLFVYREGVIRTIASGLLAGSFGSAPAFVGHRGAVEFLSLVDSAVYRYEGGNVVPVLVRGTPLPGGGLIAIRTFAANDRGDTAFNAVFGREPSQRGVFLRDRTGRITRIMAEGDPAPGGGRFSLFQLVATKGGSTGYDRALELAMNDLGTVALLAYVEFGNVGGYGLFVFRNGALERIAVDGDSAPGSPGRFDALINSGFMLNSADAIAFGSGYRYREPSNGSGPAFERLYHWVGGSPAAVALAGDLIPTPDGAGQEDSGVTTFAIADSGGLVFDAGLGGGNFSSGVFLTSPSRLPIPGGGFEKRGGSGLPSGWDTSWAGDGVSAAFLYDSGGSDAFEGTGVLRLHVGPGGSCFVLSDPIPVQGGVLCQIDARVRHYLDHEDDAVLMSLIHLDAEGRQTGFNEVRSLPGDSDWSWEPLRMALRPSAETAFVRIRFGVRSASDAYADIDAVR